MTTPSSQSLDTVRATTLALVQAADAAVEAHYAVIASFTRTQELIAEGILPPEIAQDALRLVLENASEAVQDYRAARTDAMEGIWG